MVHRLKVSNKKRKQEEEEEQVDPEECEDDDDNDDGDDDEDVSGRSALVTHKDKKLNTWDEKLMEKAVRQ